MKSSPCSVYHLVGDGRMNYVSACIARSRHELVLTLVLREQTLDCHSSVRKGGLVIVRSVLRKTDYAGPQRLAGALEGV